jgi:AcrR family transcriptional regulator
MSSGNDSRASPQAPLRRQRILDAALARADESGLKSLSMRKLAGELGVEAMSLYNHVSNKDDIIDSIVDAVVSEIRLPSPKEDWKDAMRHRAHSAHKVLLRHPWATLALVSRPGAGPAMLRYIDATLGCLCEAGFSLEEADRIWNAMDNHIYGFTLQELNFPFAEPEYADAAREFTSRVSVDAYPYFRQLAELVMKKHYDGVHDFSFGLELILEGLERYRERASG